MELTHSHHLHPWTPSVSCLWASFYNLSPVPFPVLEFIYDHPSYLFISLLFFHLNFWIMKHYPMTNSISRNIECINYYNYSIKFQLPLTEKEDLFLLQQVHPCTRDMLGFVVSTWKCIMSGSTSCKFHNLQEIKYPFPFLKNK